MARRRSFVPGNLAESSLEGRVVLSFFGSVGDWFSSQYNHVKNDLGITHKTHAASTAIVQVGSHLGKPAPASGFLHIAHPAKVK